MAVVTCKYCKQKFDRDKISFIQIPTKGITFRYAHGECYKKALENGTEKETYEIFDPIYDNGTTCFWCKKAIRTTDKNVMPMPQLPNRYVHIKCNEQYPKDDLDKLTIYIIQLFKLKDDFIIPRYMKQIQSYKDNYNFTYSGMLKALKYWYEIKGKPIDLERGVGIIPYAYKQAYDYYLAIYMADLQNQNKNFNEYIPKDIEIKIIPPKRQAIKRNLFAFIEEDNI